MGDEDSQHLTLRRLVSEEGESVVSTRRSTVLQINFVPRCAAAHRAASRFDQDLKAVADPKHWTASGGELFHSVQHGREAGDRAARR